MRAKLIVQFILASFMAPAQAYVIDFESLQAGTIVDMEYAGQPYGLTVTADNFHNSIDAAVIFDTRLPTGGDWDLGAPFTNPILGTANPGNILVLQENGPCNAASCDIPDDEGRRPAGQITFNFMDEVFLNSIDFFDIEWREARGPIRLFGKDNTELNSGEFFTPDTGGNNTWSRTHFMIGGVKTITVNLYGSGGLDNIAFSTLGAPSSVVPVPSAIWLFGSALGLLGWLRNKSAGLTRE
jgi:hypothetical protein